LEKGSNALAAAGKTSYGELFFTHHRANFNDPGAGFTGVILILPAGIARPTPAENTLAELGDRVRRAAEIAHVLGETVGVL
jgi:hypothetical protein